MRGLIIAALAVLGCVDALGGGLQSFFHVSICSLDATDIIVATPGPKKAEFQVVETIEGDLQPGETLVLSELSPPDDVAAFKKRDRDEDVSLWADPPPSMQPGDRVIVFLLRPGAHFVSEFQPEPSSLDGWRSANIWSADMRFSAAWLRNGEAFAFFQLGNPGPSELNDLNVTEQEFRRQIAKGIQLRAHLDQALAAPADSMGRALQLAELVRSDDLIAPGVAFKYLQDGSAVSAVVLRELLSDPKLVK